MESPPSGWYPDPYGTPDLLRWWDGSGWTQHTHPDVTAGGNGAGGTPAETAVLSAVSGAALDATALQGTAVQQAVQVTTFQAPVDATAVQSATGQPSAEWLSRTGPPTGPPTSPQPAVPGTPGIGLAGGYQPTTVQPGYPQPGMAWGPGTADGTGTQVFGYGQPGGAHPSGAYPSGAYPSGAYPGGAYPGGAYPGGAFPSGAYPGGPGNNPFGYQQAQQQRRRRMMIGGGIAAIAAVAVIAVIASSSGSPGAATADQSAASRPASPTAKAKPAAAASHGTPSAPASPTAPAASATPTGEALVTDAQSQLSYTLLPAPWQASPTCPLSSTVFPWSDGESAPVGQVNSQNGPVSWYGEACSGELPQQYGYTGPQDLQNAADSLASTFENAYYSAFGPQISPGQDMSVQVSGHQAWEVTFTVQYPNQGQMGSSFNGEQAAVVVVDAGLGVAPAVFFTSIPNSLGTASVATLVQSLQLGTPGAAGAQPAGQSTTGQPAPGATATGGPAGG